MKLRLLRADGRIHEISDVTQVIAFTEFDDPIMVAGQVAPGSYILVRPGEPDFAENCRTLGLEPPAVLDAQSPPTQSPMERWSRISTG